MSLRTSDVTMARQCVPTATVFRRTQRALKSVGIEISYTYDHEALGARLLDRSGLGHEQQRLLLVSTSQNLAFDQLAEAMALQFS